jgi:hypothetical protein
MMKNGSENTPEHPTGTDYETLVRALRGAGPVDDFGLRQSAADAVEALLLRSRGDAGELVKADRALKALHAENEKLRAQRDEWCARARRRHITINELTGRLDAMTVETRRTRVPASQPGPVILKLLDEQRLVGPWTVVPEGDGNV